MDNTSKKYYCDSQFSKYPENMWMNLVNDAITIADSVEFNTLWNPKRMPEELKKLQHSLIEVVKKPKRIYAGKESVRYRLSKEVIDFITSKDFRGWYNYFLEDISFRKDDIEIFATITHEFHVILLLTDAERTKLNNQGYNFDFEWMDN